MYETSYNSFGQKNFKNMMLNVDITKNEVLVIAASLGDVARVKKLLEDPGVDPNYLAEQNSKIALFEAVRRNHIGFQP